MVYLPTEVRKASANQNQTPVYGATLRIPRAVAVLVGLVLGGVPFALLGIAFGYWTPPRAALPIANLAFVPLVGATR